MLGDFMSKIMDAKRMVEETKSKLSTIEITSELENGKIKIVASANKEIKNIHIAPELLQDAEALEELLVVAINKALRAAEEKAAAELQSITGGLLPGMDNLF